MNVPLGWKQNCSYQKTPAPTPLIANGYWLGWPWQICGTRVQVSRFMWFVLVLLTGFVCIIIPPQTQILFLWNSGIPGFTSVYFENFCSRLLRFWVTAVGNTLEIEELAVGEKRLSARQSSGQCSQSCLGGRPGCPPVSQSALGRVLWCAFPWIRVWGQGLRSSGCLSHHVCRQAEELDTYGGLLSQGPSSRWHKSHKSERLWIFD